MHKNPFPDWRLFAMENGVKSTRNKFFHLLVRIISISKHVRSIFYTVISRAIQTSAAVKGRDRVMKSATEVRIPRKEKKIPGRPVVTRPLPVISDRDMAVQLHACGMLHLTRSHQQTEGQGNQPSKVIFFFFFCGKPRSKNCSCFSLKLQFLQTFNLVLFRSNEVEQRQR